MTSERRDGSTPNGGAYSIALWLDDDGNETEKANATRVIISEYAEDATLLMQTFAVLHAFR